MLRDSLVAPHAGHHVEQVEIRFTTGVVARQVIAAWTETVARTEALRISLPTGEPVTPLPILISNETPPDSWMEADRQCPLLSPHTVPWRAVYWPADRRWVWTFHHALLDGRSIARVLQHFLKRLKGEEAESLPLAEWQGPSPATLERAEKMLCEMAVQPPNEMGLTDESDLPAVAFPDIADRLDAAARAMEVTPATILTWAWGQALSQAAGTDAVLVEQLRCGPPQPATAGFTMNTLPLLIRRGDAAAGLPELRARMLELREIESVSPEDFPLDVYPDLDGPWSSVIMIERGTLIHQIGLTGLVESLDLHEAKGETLLATAYLQPALRLEVEGTGRHAMLAGWLQELERGLNPAGSGG